MLAQVDVEFASVGTPGGNQSIEAKQRLAGVTSTSGRADAKSGELKADPLNSPAISGRMHSVTHFLIWLLAHAKLHSVHPVQQLQLFSVGHQKLRQIQIELSYLTLIAKL